GPLANRRPPAGAEVDRVHADREGGGCFQAGGGLARWLPLVPARGKTRRVGLDLSLLDADEARPPRHPGAGGRTSSGRETEAMTNPEIQIREATVEDAPE